MIKRLTVAGMIVLFLASLGLTARAESGEVQVKVNVLPRKITDTENDFNFDSIAYEQSQQSRVLGVQTEKVPGKSTYRQYIAFFLTGNISFVLLDYYLSK